MGELEGVSHDDQLILRRSFRHGLVDSIRNLNVWKDPHLVADARVRVSGVGDFGIRARTDDLYHVLPSREGAVVAAIRERLRKGATFVDAGANIGFFTVLAAGIVGEAGRVFAIEMMPETVSRLRKHVSANRCGGTVTVFEAAISDRSGQTVRAIMPETKFGRASIVLEPTYERERHVTVVSKTFDELMNAFKGHIDLIKMDLEGAEDMALKGATRTLIRTQAVIFEQLPGQSGAGQLLERSGFTLRILDGNNVLAVRK
jgi:FkbM family methyltransferase